MAVASLLDQGFAHLDAGRYADAAALGQRVLRADAYNADALSLLGLAAAGSGDDAAAVDWLTQAIKAAPRRWDLHYNAATALRRLGRREEAVLRLRKAVELNPRSAAAASQLADLLHEQGEIERASALYEQALTIDDRMADAWYGLGHARMSRSRSRDAAECFRRAVELNDGLARAWFGLGCARIAQTDYAAAAAAFARCVSLDPTQAEAQQNLGQARFNLGQVDAAIGCFRQAAALASDRPDGARLRELALRSIAVAVPGSSRADHGAILAARKAWGELHRPPRAPNRERPPVDPPRADDSRRPLRIGYVSSFFARENWMKPVWALINEHDRQALAIHLFSDGPLPADRSRCAYRPWADDRFHDISSMDNESAARHIAAQGIDVLVDLNGYSRMERLPLFAHKPAPVVAGWFNMYATTGLAAFDYLIGDAHVIRPEEEAYFTERILRVEGSYLTFSVDYPVPDVAPPPCLARNRLTFGCLASQYKITGEVLDAWSAILRGVPASRLVLKNAALGVEGNRDFVRAALVERGVAAERIELEGPAEHFQFLKKYDDIDVALDTFPYNGGTTTTEAVWQGVPVVAFCGDRWAARTSASILREAALGDWVADDVEGYVRLATQWGSADDVGPRLAQLRAALRDRLRRASVCDTANFARRMEDLYRRMWTSRGVAL